MEAQFKYSRQIYDARTSTTWSLLILGDKRAYSSDGTTDKAETSIPCKIMQGYQNQKYMYFWGSV